jgi:5-methylcytosine-specific restriction endonuclease McrA
MRRLGQFNTLGLSAARKMPKACAYCGASFDLTVDHIVPISAIFPGKRLHELLPWNWKPADKTESAVKAA